MAPHHHVNKKKAPSDGRRTVVSLEDFALRGSKADGKAIAAFRNRKELKRQHKAKAFREYVKVMKKEGYEPTTKKGRKQRNEEMEKEANATGEPQNEQSASHDKTKFEQDKKQTQQHRKARTNSVKSDKQPTTTAATGDWDSREKERKQKLRERRQRTRRLRQRTSKGQPIMKHFVHDILSKLESEQK